jgi:hypothetical protein
MTTGEVLRVTALVILMPLMACSRDKAAEQTDCDIDAGLCRKTVAAGIPVEVSLDISPRPLAAMKRLLFRVRAIEKEVAIRDADVFIDLSMPGMSMMENRIPLRQQQDGSYAGEGVIVKCSSGRKVWKADVTINRPGNPTRGGSVNTSFRFRVSR